MTDTTSTVEGLSIFDVFETDASAEEQGRWFRDITGDKSGIDLKIRHLASKGSVNARRRLERGYRKHLVNGEFPEEILNEIIAKQLAEGVLVDWAGIKDRDGNVIPYSREAAESLLKKLPHFRNRILMIANNLDAFRAEEIKEGEKN